MILGEYFTFTNNFPLLDYISFGEHDEEQILKLGPGATKALQILRSHSNTPMRLKGWLIISNDFIGRIVIGFIGRIVIGFIGRIVIDVEENCIGESYVCKMSDDLK